MGNRDPGVYQKGADVRTAYDIEGVLNLIWRGFVRVGDIGDEGIPFIAQLAVQPSVDHGSLSGAKTLSAYYGLHEVALTGPTTFTPVGIDGSTLSVRVTHNDHEISLSGCSWDGDEAPTDLPDIATLVFARHDSGWYAYASGVASGPSLVPVIPTFDPETGFVDSELIIPDDLGIQYKDDGVDVAAGSHASHPPGEMTLTAAAETGFVIPDGITVSWDHTYPPLTGWNVLIADTFTGDGDIDGRTPTTSPDAATWTVDGGDSAATLAGKLVHPMAAANNYSRIAIPADAYDGFAVGLDYDLNQQLDSSLPLLKLGLDGGTVLVQITLAWNGVDDCTLTATNGGGHGAITLTGTTSGITETGRLTMRMDGTALSVELDGVEIATGTAWGTTADSTSAYINLVSCKASTFDNFEVEALTS
jgi:hypothetical protein